MRFKGSELGRVGVTSNSYRHVVVAIATASGAASSTASAEWTYLLVMLCVLWPSKLAMVGSL